MKSNKWIMVTCFEINFDILATIYEVNNKDEMLRLFDTFDKRLAELIESYGGEDNVVVHMRQPMFATVQSKNNPGEHLFSLKCTIDFQD